MADRPLSSVDLSMTLAKEEVLINDMNQRNLSVPFVWQKHLKEIADVALDDVVIYGPVGVEGVLVLGLAGGCCWCFQHQRQGQGKGIGCSMAPVEDMGDVM